MKRKLLVLIMIFLWFTVLSCVFWIINQKLINHEIQFKGFQTSHINKRFRFTGVKSKNNASWFGASGEVKNITSSDLNIEYISFHLFNKDKELIRTNEYYFPDNETESIRSGESRVFEFNLPAPNCLSATQYNQLECAKITDSSRLDVAYFTADIHWIKELEPDKIFKVQKVQSSTSLVSNIKIDPEKQSYNFNKTAKLTYTIYGKTKTIFGNFGNMVDYGITPKYIDVNNDGVNEVILVDGGNNSGGMNNVIMKLNGDALVQMNILTEIYDEYGDNMHKEYNDSGIKSMETGDYNNDGFLDLRSCTGSNVNCKTYYWNDQEELHIRKIMRGEN